MGYYAICKKSRIRITHEKNALSALLERHAKKSLLVNAETAQRLSAASSLDEALSCFMWNVIRDKRGIIVRLYLDNKFDLFEFEEVFETLAPWITDGSFLIIHGEDGAIWRMSFRNGLLNQTCTIEIRAAESPTESLKLLITNPFWALIESLRDLFLSLKERMTRRNEQ